jgi:hypothetical protein
VIITPEDEALLKWLAVRGDRLSMRAAARIRELLRDYELQRNILLEERKRK